MYALQEPLLQSVPSDATAWRPWAFLTLAILLEVTATLCMRATSVHEAFRTFGYALYLCSFSLFPAVAPPIPLAVVYALWSALGSCVVLVASCLLFGEHVAPHHVVGMGGIVVSSLIMALPPSH